MKKHTIHVFHEHDMKEMFKQLGIWDDFNAGKMKCLICDKVLTPENFGALVPYNNEIHGVCGPLCIYKAQNLVQSSSRK